MPHAENQDTFDRSKEGKAKPLADHVREVSSPAHERDARAEVGRGPLHTPARFKVITDPPRV